MKKATGETAQKAATPGRRAAIAHSINFLSAMPCIDAIPLIDMANIAPKESRASRNPVKILQQFLVFVGFQNT
ncbi:hypothetical protein [Thalassospira australica]|uniref:hypothetical protein n=1 Tax=Thalassospira australica TaxID=1528106 RepID=UPI00384FE857